MSTKKMTMGVIVGNRGFFPDQLAKSRREEMMRALAQAGIDCVVLGPEESKHGAVETHEEPSVVRRSAGHSWAAIATELGVGEGTAKRAAGR